MPACATAESNGIHALVSAAAARLSSERDWMFMLLTSFASMLQALLEAEGKGETWKVLGLPAAPHLIGVDGEVRVPDRWENLIRGSEGYMEYMQQQKAANLVAKATKGPNRTIPRSPISS